MAQVVVELSGDEAKLWKAYQKVIEQSKKLDDSNKSLKQSSQAASKAATDGFGSQAVNALKSYAMGYVGVSQAIGAVTSALKAARAAAQEAMANVDGLTESRRRLIQVGTSAADVQEQNVMADLLAREYGVPRGEARGLMFAARSEQFAGSERDIMRLARANVIDLESAITSAGMVRGNFDFAMSAMAAVIATLKGAETSRLSAEQFAATIPKLSGVATGVGATPAETMAAVSVLATRNERASEYAGTLIGRLGIDKQFQGKGIVGAVESLAELPEDQRRQILGVSKEMNMAFEWLRKDAQRIRDTRQAIEQSMAEPEAFIAEKERQGVFGDTREAQLRRAQVAYSQSRIGLEMAQEQAIAEGGYRRESAVLQFKEQQLGRGGGVFSRYAAGKAAEWMADLNAPAGAVGVAGRATEAAYDAAAFPAIRIVMGSWSAAADAMARAAAMLTGAAEDQSQAASNLRDSSNTSRQRASIAVPVE